MACGPPKTTTMAGIVMNGPMPHICDMLMAVACRTPIRRRRCGCAFVVVMDAPADPGSNVRARHGRPRRPPVRLSEAKAAGTARHVDLDPGPPGRYPAAVSHDRYA